MRTVLRTLLASLALLALASPAAAKEYSADRFDVQVRVLPGNLLEVAETIVFRFEDGTFSFVFREIAARRTDGIEIVAATMDGRPFPFGNEVNQAEVKGSSKVNIRWRFTPVGPSTHTFGLTYRVRGAVRRADGHDELYWQALPTSHDYRIAASTATFTFPGLPPATGTATLAPHLDSRRVNGRTSLDGLATAEAGGESVAGARATATDIGRNGWIAARFSLPAGQLIMTPPDWQAQDLRAATLGPYWLAGAGGVVLAGLIVLFGIRQQYDPVPSDIVRLTPSSLAPEALDPALAGALISNGRPSHQHAVAALFAMAERGAVEIEERPKGRFGQRSFAVRRPKGRPTLKPQETVLLDLLFGDTDTATLPHAWRRVARHFKRFSAAVSGRLQGEGLLDADRQRIRRRIFGFAALCLILAALSAVLGALLVRAYGPWPLVIPGASAVVAVIGFIVGGATTPLSNSGAQRAARWRAYREGLKGAAETGGSSFTLRASDVLAMAVALGLGGLWSKQLKKHPGLAPAWFQGLGDSDPGAIAALVAMGDASHGAAGAGAGAAGAAGGGASGAG